MPRTHYQLLGVAPTATRAEIDAALTRRESQYRELVRTGQRPGQEIIDRIRKAHETLVDPDKRASYDRKLARAARRAAASATTDAGSSWPTTGRGSRREESGSFFTRAWRGKARAWQPFWLMVVPALLLAVAAVLLADRLRSAVPANLLAPLGVASGALVAVLALAGAALLWRCAFNVDRRILGYLARALSVLVLAGAGVAIHWAATAAWQ